MIKWIVLMMAVPVLCLGSVGIVGELVPFHYGRASYGVPFIGMDAYWPLNHWGPYAAMLTDNPFVPNGWYEITFGGLYRISQAGWIGIGLSNYLHFEDFQIAKNSTWTFYAAGRTLFWERLGAFVRFNVPLRAPADAPFFGAWISLGLSYEFGGGGGEG